MDGSLRLASRRPIGTGGGGGVCPGAAEMDWIATRQLPLPDLGPGVGRRDGRWAMGNGAAVLDAMGLPSLTHRNLSDPQSVPEANIDKFGRIRLFAHYPELVVCRHRVAVSTAVGAKPLT